MNATPPCLQAQGARRVSILSPRIALNRTRTFSHLLVPLPILKYSTHGGRTSEDPLGLRGFLAAMFQAIGGDAPHRRACDSCGQHDLVSCGQGASAHSGEERNWFRSTRSNRSARRSFRQGPGRRCLRHARRWVPARASHRPLGDRCCPDGGCCRASCCGIFDPPSNHPATAAPSPAWHTGLHRVGGYGIR